MDEILDLIAEGKVYTARRVGRVPKRIGAAMSSTQAKINDVIARIEAYLRRLVEPKRTRARGIRGLRKAREALAKKQQPGAGGRGKTKKKKKKNKSMGRFSRRSVLVPAPPSPTASSTAEYDEEEGEGLEHGHGGVDYSDKKLEFKSASQMVFLAEQLKRLNEQMAAISSMQAAAPGGRDDNESSDDDKAEKKSAVAALASLMGAASDDDDDDDDESEGNVPVAPPLPPSAPVAAPANVPPAPPVPPAAAPANASAATGTGGTCAPGKRNSSFGSGIPEASPLLTYVSPPADENAAPGGDSLANALQKVRLRKASEQGPLANVTMTARVSNAANAQPVKVTKPDGKALKVYTRRIPGDEELSFTDLVRVSSKISLRQTGIPRSPGGTPHRARPTDNSPFAQALFKKFKSVRKEASPDRMAVAARRRKSMRHRRTMSRQDVEPAEWEESTPAQHHTLTVR